MWWKEISLSNTLFSFRIFQKYFGAGSCKFCVLQILVFLISISIKMTEISLLEKGIGRRWEKVLNHCNSRSALNKEDRREEQLKEIRDEVVIQIETENQRNYYNYERDETGKSWRLRENGHDIGKFYLTNG